MLVSKLTGVALSIWLPIFNLPLIALGYRQMGAAFALRSAAAIGGLSLVLATVHYPDVTHDLVLTAVFGGFFIGAGIGLAVRGGAVLDGAGIAALLISRRSHLLKVGDVILLFNIVLFVTAMSCSALWRRSLLPSSPTSLPRARSTSSSTASRNSRQSPSSRARAARSPRTSWRTSDAG